jgi:hypothetical protein
MDTEADSPSSSSTTNTSSLGTHLPLEADKLLHDLAKDFDGDPRYFRHCGLGTMKRHVQFDGWKQEFLRNKISIVAVNMNSHFSFLNSAMSWAEVGLLGAADERIAILSNATAIEVAIAVHFGFRVIRARDIESAFKLDVDVLTLSAAFYYGLQSAKNENVLFLESDFSIDLQITSKQLRQQLVGAVGMLDRGAMLVRMMSRKGMGTFSFQKCDHQKFDDVDRKRNWYTFYCNAAGQKKVQQAGNTCLTTPLFKCFTSRDSNWSLNACLVRRSSMLQTQFKFSLPAPQKKRKRKPVDLSRFMSADNKTVTMSIPDIGLHLSSHKQVSGPLLNNSISR